MRRYLLLAALLLVGCGGSFSPTGGRRGGDWLSHQHGMHVSRDGR